jgi:hypothetical protein
MISGSIMRARCKTLRFAAFVRFATIFVSAICFGAEGDVRLAEASCAATKRCVLCWSNAWM